MKSANGSDYVIGGELKPTNHGARNNDYITSRQIYEVCRGSFAKCAHSELLSRSRQAKQYEICRRYSVQRYWKT